MSHMVFISPHLDDAVFSCSEWLTAYPGSIVVTLFAGFPAEDSNLTEWDARCGFTTAEEAVMMRRVEDRAALGLLGARAVWLDFLDGQYGPSSTPREICRALRHVLSDLDVSSIVIPMGLFHLDHLLAHDAALMAAQDLDQQIPIHLYEDVPYRALSGLLQQRLSILASRGLIATPCQNEEESVHAAMRMKATALYASQLRAMGPSQQADIARAQRIWRVERHSQNIHSTSSARRSEP